MAKVSIIIPAYNNWAYTRRCLDSIFENTPRGILGEIIVVDNNSVDETAVSLNDYQVRVIVNNKNLGFAKACNQGAELAKNELILFLNNDTIVTKNWLQPLVKEMENSKIGMVSPKLIFPNGLIQHIGKAFDEELNHYSLYANFSMDKPQVNKKREFQAVIAACILMRREVFFRVEGFDEKYINGGEDNDLCFKVRKLGLKILYSPDSVVIHHESTSVNQQGNLEELFKANRERFHKKWNNYIIPDLRKFYAEDGFLDTFTIMQDELIRQKKWIKHLERDNKRLRGALDAKKTIIDQLFYYGKILWKRIKKY